MRTDIMKGFHTFPSNRALTIKQQQSGVLITTKYEI